MANVIAKMWKRRWVLRSLFKTIYFNFHYLPFSQARKLPVLLYKPRLKKLRGKVAIEGPVKFGMISLGHPYNSIYPRGGVVIENHGGSLTFKGACRVGGDSLISIGEKGCVELGDTVRANGAFRLICFHRVSLSSRVTLAWDCTVMDTDFHRLTAVDGSPTSRGYAPVTIGENCWIGLGTLILKGTTLPPYTTVQGRSVLAGRYDIPTHCVIGNDTTIVVKKTGVYRDYSNDLVVYE